MPSSQLLAPAPGVDSSKKALVSLAGSTAAAVKRTSKASWSPRRRQQAVISSPEPNLMALRSRLLMAVASRCGLLLTNPRTPRTRSATPRRAATLLASRKGTARTSASWQLRWARSVCRPPGATGRPETRACRRARSTTRQCGGRRAACPAVPRPHPASCSGAGRLARAGADRGPRVTRARRLRRSRPPPWPRWSPVSLFLQDPNLAEATRPVNRRLTRAG